MKKIKPLLHSSSTILRLPSAIGTYLKGEGRGRERIGKKIGLSASQSSNEIQKHDTYCYFTLEFSES